MKPHKPANLLKPITILMAGMGTALFLLNENNQREAFFTDCDEFKSEFLSQYEIVPNGAVQKARAIDPQFSIVTTDNAQGISKTFSIEAMAITPDLDLFLSAEDQTTCRFSIEHE